MHSAHANPRVLVFDSGVGGLTIYREIQRQLPGVDLLFASDNAAYPYGPQPEDALVARVDQVLHRLIQHWQPDLAVVACNTASTVALPRIRSRLSIPVVGVVPAIKPAAALSRSRVIGLLATPGTVARAYTDQLIADFAADCTVVKVGSRELVDLAEQKLRGEALTHSALAPILAPLFEHPELDTVVLGCTHFPLLIEELTAAAPRTVQWVDSGDAIARRVAWLLRELDREPLAASQGRHQSLFTQGGETLESLRATLTQFGCADCAIVEV